MRNVAIAGISAPNYSSGKPRFYSRDVRQPLADIFTHDGTGSIGHHPFADLGTIHSPSGHGAWLPWAAFEALIDSKTGSVIRMHRDVAKPMALVMQYIM